MHKIGIPIKRIEETIRAHVKRVPNTFVERRVCGADEKTQIKTDRYPRDYVSLKADACTDHVRETWKR